MRTSLAIGLVLLALGCEPAGTKPAASGAGPATETATASAVASSALSITASAVTSGRRAVGSAQPAGAASARIDKRSYCQLPTKDKVVHTRIGHINVDATVHRLGPFDIPITDCSAAWGVSCRSFAFQQPMVHRVGTETLIFGELPQCNGEERTLAVVDEHGHVRAAWRMAMTGAVHSSNPDITVRPSVSVEPKRLTATSVMFTVEWAVWESGGGPSTFDVMNVSLGGSAVVDKVAALSDVRSSDLEPKPSAVRSDRRGISLFMEGKNHMLVARPEQGLVSSAAFDGQRLLWTSCEREQTSCQLNLITGDDPRAGSRRVMTQLPEYVGWVSALAADGNLAVGGFRQNRLYVVRLTDGSHYLLQPRRCAKGDPVTTGTTRMDCVSKDSIDSLELFGNKLLIADSTSLTQLELSPEPTWLPAKSPDASAAAETAPSASAAVDTAPSASAADGAPLPAATTSSAVTPSPAPSPPEQRNE